MSTYTYVYIYMLIFLVLFYIMAILSPSNFLFKTCFPIKEHVSSPLSAQILEFCESDLFSETTQNSEVASSSNCCYDDHCSFSPDIIKYSDANNFSIIFNGQITENDVINSVNYLDFTTYPHLNLPPYQFSNQDLQFDLNLQIPFTNDEILPYPHHTVPVIGPAFPSVVYEDDGLSSLMARSKLMCLNNPPNSLHCSFMDPSYPPAFNGDMFLGELDFKVDNPLPQLIYNSNELQALSNESQHLVNGGVTPLTSEITSMESETFRVTNKLTGEERKEKIHRYMKKRNKRNFSKKIKYVCRKTLADRRPRVRGRFAKNDEFGENNRSNGHEDDTAELDVKSFHVVVKEEDEENLESSSDIYAHISGLNSFKCTNYPIQSWI